MNGASDGLGDTQESRMGNVLSHQEIIQHMTRHFGPVQEMALVELVPVSGIAIHVIPPRPDEDSLVLFTSGMSDRPQKVPANCEDYRYTELILRLPGDWPLDLEALKEASNSWPFEWLKRIAAYPQQNETWLGGPFAIIANGEPPEPFAPSTGLSCMLLLKEPGDAGTVQCKDGKRIVLYSMVPLYSEERDLEETVGKAGLLERFQTHDLTLVVDPARVNIAARDPGARDPGDPDRE